MVKLLNLSASAIRRLKYLKDAKDKYLYINITGGGCSGFEYHFNLVGLAAHAPSSPRGAGDHSQAGETNVLVYDDKGVKIFSNPESTELISGCTLDFQQELIGSKFVLDDIQNSVRKCSCGNSFDLKD